MKKIFKHPLGIGITVTVIGAIVTALLRSQVLIEGLITTAVNLLGWIKKVLLFGIPVWLLLVGVGVLYLVFYVLLNRSDNNKSNFLTYNTDEIDGVKWEWEWFRSYEGKYDISLDRLIPVCKNCKGFLIQDNHFYNGFKLKCEHCNFEKRINDDLGMDQYLDKTKREIFRRIRAGERQLK